MSHDHSKKISKQRVWQVPFVVPPKIGGTKTKIWGSQLKTAHEELWRLVLHRAAGELSLIVTNFEQDRDVTMF